MSSPFLPIIYAAVIFSIGTVGGLMALRGLKSVALRAVAFVVLAFLLMRVTFWLARPWDLDPVELGIAWALALVAATGLEVIRVSRNKRRLA